MITVTLYFLNFETIHVFDTRNFEINSEDSLLSRINNPRPIRIAGIDEQAYDLKKAKACMADSA